MAPTTTRGNCEFCQQVDVTLTIQHGDLMCDECIAREAAIVTTQSVITESRKIDSAIVLKKDIWNAATISFSELEAAIEHDETIPADQKKFRVAEEFATRIQKLDAAIFAHDEAGANMKNERHALLQKTQEFVATLRAEQRAKLPQYDVTYKSKPITKTVKSTRPVKAGKSFTAADRTAVFAAAKKYDVPAHSIQMLLQSRNGMSVDAAAREMATILGKL